MTNKITTSIGEVYEENGILYHNFLAGDGDGDGGLAQIRTHFLRTKEAFGHLLPLPFLMRTDSNTRSASKEVRDYFATEEFSALTKGLAVITDSMIVRMMANLVLKTQRRSYPTQLFTDEAKAIAWLRSL